MAEIDDEVRQGEGEDEGPGSGGQEYEDASSQAQDDAAFDTGEEQEAGVEDDLTVSRSRRPDDYQRLSDEAADLRKQLDDLRRGQQQAYAPREETEQEFQARISLLSLDERNDAKFVRAERFNQMRMNMLAFQLQDQADRAEYNATAASDPLRRQYADEVEKRLRELHAQGKTATREDMFYYVLGQKRASPKGRKEVERQRQDGERRVARQQSRPSAGRSDVSRGDRRALNEREARARRLEGQDI